MADIQFIPKARNANAIPNEPFSNGSLIAATDTGELYVDYNGARMRIGDVITLETEAQRIATLAPLPKLYYVTETGKLWRFADDWVCVNPDDVESNMLSVGKSTFFNVASYTHNGNAYELLLKTPIPLASGACNIVVHVRGNSGDAIVDFFVHHYYSGANHTYCSAVNNGSFKPDIKVFSYTTDRKYLGIAISGLMYYPRLTVDLFDMWSIYRRYGKNWIVEANTTSSTTSIIPTDDLAEVSWQPIYNDIEADTVKADIVQAGRHYYNVATINHSGNVYEILIKTRIPVVNQAWMPVVYIHGHTARNMVDLALIFYYNAELTWATFTNKGTWAPTIKYFTYTDEDGEDYIGIALIGTSYYGKYQVDLSDIWTTTRNYGEGWTVEYNTSQDTTIVPTTNLVEAEQYRIATGIIGKADNAAAADTLNSTLPINKGGTGATNASSARTALEAGYTIRRSITTTGAGWYRIAATTASVGRNYTDVYIDASLAGKNSQIGLIAAVTYGTSTTDTTAIQLSQKAFVEQYKDGVTKVRIVYPNSSYANQYAYLEIYQAYDASATYSIELQNCRGWATRYDEPIAGEIPDGYSAREITLVHNAVVADRFVGDVVGTADFADFAKNYVGRIDPDSPTAPDFFSTSLNDARTPGWYSVAGIPSNIDGPTEAGTNKVWGLLQVGTSTGETIPEGSNGWVMQTLTLTTDEVYHRNVVNATAWKEWIRYVDSNDVATSLTTSYTNKIPTVDAAKTYIDAQVAEVNGKYLPLTGGTLTGSLTAKSFRGIVNPPLNQGSSFLNEPNISAAACVPELMADRLQFFPPANCLLETSSDSTSWTTRSTPNAQKQQLLCCHPSYTAGIDWTAGTQLRITFTADSYVFLSLLYLYLRTSGKIDVIIEQFRNASQDWVEVARQEQVTGQPIHVVLWHTVIRFQNSTNDMHSGKVRVTLIHTGTDTPILDQLRWKGGYPTANPYIYDWDPSRNVMFPAEVRANNFNGQWSGKTVASSFDENSTTTVPTCKQIADYVKSLIGG